MWIKRRKRANFRMNQEEQIREKKLSEMEKLLKRKRGVGGGGGEGVNEKKAACDGVECIM
jgi:hypothetical protein